MWDYRCEIKNATRSGADMSVCVRVFVVVRSSVAPHTHDTLHPTLEKFCPTVPRLMLIGILGTKQPLLLDTKCTHDTQVVQELLSGSPDAEKRQPC